MRNHRAAGLNQLGPKHYDVSMDVEWQAMLRRSQGRKVTLKQRQGRSMAARRKIGITLATFETLEQLIHNQD